METYPISEIFVAPQGEGAHVGRLMTFVRLAGCTVGTRYPKAQYLDSQFSVVDPYSVMSDPLLPLLPIYTNECHIYDGRTMACDTDYRLKERLTAKEIIARVKSLSNCRTICISGGEPLMHDLLGLMRILTGRFRLHIETSGTIPFSEKNTITSLGYFNHVAVSPKLGFREEYAYRASELKILVDENFNWDNLSEAVRRNSSNIFLQPVNFEHSINMVNVKKALEIQMQHPEVMMGGQMHKLWEVR